MTKKKAVKVKTVKKTLSPLDKEFERILNEPEPLVDFKKIPKATKLALAKHMEASLRDSFDKKVLHRALKWIDKRSGIYSDDTVNFSYDWSVNGLALHSMIKLLEKTK